MHSTLGRSPMSHCTMQYENECHFAKTGETVSARKNSIVYSSLGSHTNLCFHIVSTTYTAKFSTCTLHCFLVIELSTKLLQYCIHLPVLTGICRGSPKSLWGPQSRWGCCHGNRHIYGVAVLVESSRGIQWLYEIKQRQKSKPIPICLIRVSSIEKWGNFPFCLAC